MHAFGDIISKGAVRRSVFRQHLRYIVVSEDATSAVKPTTCVAPPSQEIRDAHLTKDPNGAATLRKPNRPKYLGAPLIIERHPKTHEDADMKQTHS